MFLNKLVSCEIFSYYALLLKHTLLFMGRPATRPTKLKDGYYIEIRNKGSRSGVKLYSGTKLQMHRAIKMYERSKEVIILGKSVDGKFVDKEPKLHVAD